MFRRGIDRQHLDVLQHRTTAELCDSKPGVKRKTFFIASQPADKYSAAASRGVAEITHYKAGRSRLYTPQYLSQEIQPRLEQRKAAGIYRSRQLLL